MGGVGGVLFGAGYLKLEGTMGKKLVMPSLTSVFYRDLGKEQQTDNSCRLRRLGRISR